MRRKDREIKIKAEMLEIIKKAFYCSVAMSKDNYPYIIPMNYGFSGDTLYLHSANEGLKINILKNNSNVCIEIIQNVKVKQNPEVVCNTEMQYNSVIIFGQTEFLSNKDEKLKALRCIVEHYYPNIMQSGEDRINFDANVLDKLTILKVKIEKITGKRSI